MGSKVWLIVVAAWIVLPFLASPCFSQHPNSPIPDPTQPSVNAAAETDDDLSESLDAVIDPQRLASSVQLAVTMMVLGLVPAILLMTTSYVRITVVLGLLRQAFGAQQIIPAQVTTAIAMFCTTFVMWPTWQTVYHDALMPWIEGEDEVQLEEVWQKGVQPVRDFMLAQIDMKDNEADLHLFLRHTTMGEDYPREFDDVPLQALLPAFLLSELKIAFLIGFRIYLPFLVIDLVVASITTSMGMFMLPPTTVSMPLKLLLFVMVDGWHLLIEMLLLSFVQ